MRKIFLLAGCLSILSVFCTTLFAQGNVKVGHTNSNYIIGLMPETKKAQGELETMKKQLEKVLQEKSKTFEEKVERYQTSAASMSQTLRETTEAELQKLRTELQELQGKSESSFMEKQQALFKPIAEKVNKAIKEVGKEEGYLYVLNGDTGNVGNPVLLYSGSENSDITNLVLKKLGVTPPAKQ
ncbi:OmpH family outer membrane protein [Ravibacter arvi]